MNTIHFLTGYTENTELNDLRIIICLRKSEVTVEKISVCNAIEKLMEHCIDFVMLLYKGRHRSVPVATMT